MSAPDKKVDVLVVGGGPAGSCAAKAAADSGASVLMVERQSRIGADPRCAEWAPAALKLERGIPARAQVQPVSGMRIRLPGIEAAATAPGVMLDRRVFDYDLALQAAHAGAEIWTGSRFVGMESGRAQIMRGKELNEVAFSALVAADGPSSKVAAAMGLERQPLMAALQFSVPLKSGLDQTLVFLRPEYPMGYAWLFPKGKEANLGLGCVAPRGLSKLLHRLHAELNAEGLTGPGVLGICAGALPVGGPRPVLARNNIFLCGDAAGLTHPVTGAGIPQALDSGARAGSAAAGFARGLLDAADNYSRKVLSRWGGYLERGLKARARQEAGWQSADFQTLMAQTWPAWPKAK